MTVESKLILEALRKLFDVPGFVEKLNALKQININPFKQKTDGTPEGWANLKDANVLIFEITNEAISVAEKVCAEAGLVARGQDKLDAVVSFLDECIKMPFPFELIDGPAIKFAVSALVSGLNKLFGKDWLNSIPIPTNR
jgi:hypothetical protein